jgi:hypothetical protein
MTFLNSNCRLTIVVNDSCRGWAKLTAKNCSCHATSVQGLLIKKHYPGLVTVEGREIVPEKWHHFFLVKDVKTDEVLTDKIKR